MRRAPVEANTPMAVAMTLLWTSKGPKENPDLIRRSLPIFQISPSVVDLGLSIAQEQEDLHHDGRRSICAHQKRTAQAAR